jgi:hypothetical protein
MISVVIIFSLCFLPNLIDSSIPFVLNPDCDIPECKDFSQGALYYGSHLVGDNKIHMIYSSFDELTIMMMQTGKDEPLIFNYTALASKNYTGAFRFNGTWPVNSLTLIVRRLIEFNDTDDSGMMTETHNTTNSYFLSNLTLTNLTSDNNHTNQPSFEYIIDEV